MHKGNSFPAKTPGKSQFRRQNDWTGYVLAFGKQPK